MLLDNVLNAENIFERTAALTRMRKYVKKVMYYKWYYEKLTPEHTNEEIAKQVDYLKRSVYKREDVYFRKANFVYRFFSPYLVDEECIVTKDMVRDLIDRCDKVLAKVDTEKIFTKSGLIKDDFFYRYKKGENWFDMTKKRKKEEDRRIKRYVRECGLHRVGWQRYASQVLPTVSGFFFGSTDYDVYYLRDVMDCKTQFEKLLKNWKEGEIVYNSMSW